MDKREGDQLPLWRHEYMYPTQHALHELIISDVKETILKRLKRGKKGGTGDKKVGILGQCQKVR